MKALHLVRDPFFQCRGDHKWNLSFVLYRLWQSRSMALAIRVLVAIRVQTFVAKHESLVETPLFCGYEFLHAYFWCNSILLDAYFVILRKMWHISIGALQESDRCSKIFDGPEPATNILELKHIRGTECMFWGSKIFEAGTLWDSCRLGFGV